MDTNTTTNKKNNQHFDDMNMGSYLKERLAQNQKKTSSDGTSTVSQKKSSHNTQKAKSDDKDKSSKPSQTGSPEASSSADTDSSGTDSLKAEASSLEPALSTLVLSLSSAALIALGLATDPSADPSKDPKKADKPMAKFNIDMLIMLREKTKGNLSSHEEKLIDAIVSDLQMKYVEMNN